MAVLNFAAPILPGKLEQWRAWQGQFAVGGPQRAEWEDQMRRYKVTRQVVSLQQTPNGDFVIVLFEGADPGAVMAGMAGSDNEFDKSFAKHIMEVHGIDVSQPPAGPMSGIILEVIV